MDKNLNYYIKSIIENISELNDNEKNIVLIFCNENFLVSNNKNGFFFDLKKGEIPILKKLDDLINSILKNRETVNNYLLLKKEQQEKLRNEFEENIIKKQKQDREDILNKISIKEEEISIKITKEIKNKEECIKKKEIYPPNSVYYNLNQKIKRKYKSKSFDFGISKKPDMNEEYEENYEEEEYEEDYAESCDDENENGEFLREFDETEISNSEENFKEFDSEKENDLKENDSENFTEDFTEEINSDIYTKDFTTEKDIDTSDIFIKKKKGHKKFFEKIINSIKEKEIGKEKKLEKKTIPQNENENNDNIQEFILKIKNILIEKGHLFNLNLDCKLIKQEYL